MRVFYAIHALVCTHPRVAPEFANDLPRCHIPQHHRLVPAAGAETAVVKGAGGKRKERQGRPRSRSLHPFLGLVPGSPGRIQHLVAVATVRPQQRPSQRIPQLQGLVAAARQTVIAIHWGTPGRDYRAEDLRRQEDPERRGSSPLNRTARTAPCPQSNVFTRFCGSSGPRGFGSGKAICFGIPSSPPYIGLHRGFRTLGTHAWM